MAIEYLTKDILYVALPKTPHINHEIEPVSYKITTGQICSVILDFDLVDIVTSSSISALLNLQNLLNAHGRQLILCSVSFLTKCEFTTTGLSHFFRFVENKSVALKALHQEVAPI